MAVTGMETPVLPPSQHEPQEDPAVQVDEAKADEASEALVPLRSLLSHAQSLPASSSASLDLANSSDDNGDSHEESDWKTSSSSESRLSVARFSLLDLPSKVRASVFRRPTRKKKARSNTADTTRTSSLPSTTESQALQIKQRTEVDHVEKFRVFWDEKLRHTMEKLAGNLAKPDAGHALEPQSDVFHLLLKLYAHQDVVEQLYSSYEANADEFEFYIPQLCTFLLHGNYAKQHQLECFLMSRSGESLPFAHRLTWFLRSFCDDAREYQSEYLSVTASPDQENSDLLTAIGMRAGVPALLMNNGLCVEEVSAAKPGNLQRRRSIVFPIDNEMDLTALETDELFAGHLLSKRNSVENEARTEEGNSQQFSLYKQTPDFVEALTDLAEQLIPTPLANRNVELRKGLSEIQEKLLPSEVLYLPIGNSFHRVKAIHVDECFTFSTKERVPYFLCVEVLDYSVSSPASAPTKKVRRRKSKASRNQSRGFSLKLPFKKNGMAGVETMIEDDSMMSSTSPESGLSPVETVESSATGEIDLEGLALFECGMENAGSALPTPLASSPLPEIEEEKIPASSLVNSDGLTVAELVDGEDGDDEKEIEEKEDRKSLLEDEDLQKATEEQQERMGQWSLPRSRRRGSKGSSSSASARSGAQFDSFYSSWFSKKTKRENEVAAGAASTQAISLDSTENAVQDDEGKQTDGEKVDETSVVVIKAEVEEEAVASEGAHSSSQGPATVSAGPGAIFSALFSRKPKQEISTQPADDATSSNQLEDQSSRAEESETVATECGIEGTEALESGSLETAAPSAAPVQSVGLFGSLFSKKAKADGVHASSTPESAHPSENQQSLEIMETKANDSAAEDASPTEASAAAVAEPVGIFASLFSKKPKQDAEADALASDGTDASVSSLEPSEEGLTDDLDAEDADGEETDSKESIPSDSEPISSEPAVEPVEKASSFAAWFSRKPASEADGVCKKTEAAAEEPAKSDENSADGGKNPHQEAVAVKCDPPTDEKTASSDSISAADPMPSTPAVDYEDSSQDEALPKTRQRDLSVSLDFADPDAWTLKFDLEDGLTDDEPDAEATDTDVEADIQEESERHDDEEKPMIVFRERWSEKEARIRCESPFGDHPGWRLLSVIVKSNDDLRQEQFAAQLIAQCDRIFREYSLPLSLRPYNVIATSAKTGLIEAVPDTVSLDSLKRNDPDYTSLLDFYYRLHGDKESTGFARAQRNFVESLAAYSMVCYVFQIKDRHNGNILLDTQGHVIHIDFGFLLTNSPGSNWNFERAPFKLTDEFVQLMGGPRSSTFRYFRSLCIRAYLALRRNMDQIVLLVEMMLVGNADLPCFAGGKKAVIDGLRARLKPGVRTSTCQVFVNQLIDQSINNWRTRWYDKYQRACLGIL